MKRRKIVLAFNILLIVFLISSCKTTNQEEQAKPKSNIPEYTLVIHGGAGTIKKANMEEETETAVHNALSQALEAGKLVLDSGGSAMDAVAAAITILEDDPHFNAGKGSVFTWDGINEMDASFMDGKTLNAGAVAGVTKVKHPILAARAVMEKSPHVFLSGVGADQFAEEQSLELVPSSWFYTERRFQSHKKAKEKQLEKVLEKHGTVGAVALDKNGNLAAGTSTGGMTNKRYNRIGDSPVIGAGTYADNESCAVSCTGHGEFFIRLAVAHDISSLVKYKKMDAKSAAKEVIQIKLTDIGATGFAIVLDKNGVISMEFNTEGMYRGYITPDRKEIKMYRE